tara:strand:- start:55 stop:186 length:132 start_codon:yes stop_codon:yes gene_type:complete
MVHVPYSFVEVSVDEDGDRIALGVASAQGNALAGGSSAHIQQF